MFRTAIIFFGLTCAALAHDHNHPEMNDWYRSLHAKGGAWCCKGDDSLPAEYDTKDAHYRVRIDNEWIAVPDDAVVETPNKAGEAKVWLYWTNGRVNIRCFMPGAGI